MRASILLLISHRALYRLPTLSPPRNLNLLPGDCIYPSIEIDRSLRPLAIPQGGKGFRFRYEYDFGDSWEHEVLCEGRPTAEAGGHYPLCVAGKRACPPEDVGGVWGYADFCEAIQDPDNERHEEMLEWVGGTFDPEAFDPAAATQRMKQGLPDWRRIR